MSTPKTISIGMGLTIQPAAYEAIKSDIRVDIELADNDSLDAEVTKLALIVRDKLQEVVERTREAYLTAEGKPPVSDDRWDDADDADDKWMP